MKIETFIKKTLKKYHADKKIPGIALGLIKDGQLLHLLVQTR